MRRRRFAAEKERRGYIGIALALHCIVAGDKFGPGAEPDRRIGGIRHDVPVDTIALILDQLAHHKCDCEVDELGATYHRDCLPLQAREVIGRLMEKPRE